MFKVKVGIENVGVKPSLMRRDRDQVVPNFPLGGHVGHVGGADDHRRWDSESGKQVGLPSAGMPSSCAERRSRLAIPPPFS